MKSVFDTNPPSFTINEAEQLLKKRYNILGELKELYSDRDQNFFVKNIDNEFILKVANAAENYQVIDLQDKAADKTLRELSNEKKSLENNALIDPVVRIEAIKRNAEMQEAVFDKYNRNWEKVKP